MAVAMVMRGMLVLLGLFRRYMPAAIVTGGGFFITWIAQKRAPLKILLQAGLIVCRQIARIAWQRQIVAATVALAPIPVG